MSRSAPSTPDGSAPPPARPRGRWRRSALARAVLDRRGATVGAVLVLALVLLALLAPLISRLTGQTPYGYHPDALDPASGLPAGALGGVSGTHWFGVEPLTGRDLFAIVAHGARTSFLIGVLATVVAVVLGVVLGASAGYLGGWWDRVVGWTGDVIFGFPYLVFMVALGAVAPPSIPRTLLLVVVIGFFGWPRVARVVRSATLGVARRDFVRASQVMGSPTWRTLTRRVLPNLWGPVVVIATLSIPERIGLEAALSFLGVGVPPPTPSWGRSISDAIGWVQTDPMFLVFPGLALFAATLAFNLVGDGLRDVLDPRTAREGAH
ncbi:ABC transporter permease [Kineococcus rhizosphaerae]|uniref:Peptide/nickel transport system permease protein n=1 Tax=Kineococcus rhizosphaerae TaxID=559628 RepID=A0A2T0R7N8_9ACTN|nr:ABC transporter permease [Kineococcus rhizosphaerae]PRY17185.1 peptide/nickel transport system permease protein [Kineococcus rhizosphaerae]